MLLQEPVFAGASVVGVLAKGDPSTPGHVPARALNTRWRSGGAGGRAGDVSAFDELIGRPGEIALAGYPGAVFCEPYFSDAIERGMVASGKALATGEGE